MAWSPEISQLSTDVDQLTDAVNVKKNQLSGAVTSAQTSKTSANTSAGVAESGAVLSAASMQTANTHKNSTLSVYGTQAVQQASIGTAAGQASAAATSAVTATAGLTQDLSGITAQALHRSPNAVTSMFVYDTSKDSDGGAWTEKCQHTSWWNEPIMGKWLGQQISEFQARNAGATVGPELITNGDFSGGSTGWTVATGWSIANSEATFVGGTAEYLKWPSSIIVGKLYKFTFTIKSVSGTAPSVSVYMGQSPSLGTFVTPGTYTVYGVAIAGSLGFAIRGNNANVDAIIVIDSVSVREIISLTTASTDYFQLTTDGKFYRLWNNTFTWSDQFDNAAWRHNSYTTNLTITPNAVGNPVVGALSGADLLVPTTTSAGHGIQHLAISGGAYVEVVAKASGYSCIAITDGGNNFTVRFDLTGSGTTVTETGSPTEVSILALSDGWYRCRLRLPNTVQGGQFRIYVRQSISGGAWASYAGDGTSGVLLASAQQTIGSFFDTYEAKSAEGSISEVFRGNKRDFPRLAGIVGEANSISIYDLTEPGRPMWMRLNSIPNSGYAGMILLNTNQTGIAAVNGNFILGGNGPWQSWCTVLNFVKETGRSYGSGGSGNVHLIWRSSFANRHTAGLYEQVSLAAENIAGATTNAVAATVLPDAPTDPVTGLRVPTIAVATNGGVSVIKHNGTVVNSASTVGYGAIAIDKNFLIIQASTAVGQFLDYAKTPNLLSTSFAMIRINSNSAPDLARGTASKFIQSSRGTFARGGSNALFSYLRNNEDAISKGLASVVTPTFNTGWMLGDIRRAYLSDTDVGSVAGPDLVTNGDFSAGADGWVLNSAPNSLQSVVNGRLRITSIAPDSNARSSQAVSTQPGRTYKIILTAYNGTAIQGPQLKIGNSIGSGDLFFTDLPNGIVYENRFTASTSTTYITVQTNQGSVYSEFDDISVRQAIADRSYKNKSISITGTLTKSQLAAGTSLVGYSGFSAANYLREPYSADLDFGTGEFSASAWVNIPASIPTTSFPVVGSELVTNGTFNSDSTGWSSTGNSSNAVVNGELEITHTAASNGVTQFITGLTIGKTYQVSVTGRRGTSNSWNLLIGTSTATSPISLLLGDYTNTVNVTSSGTFVALETTHRLYVRAGSASYPNTAYVNNVSVKEVAPAIIFDRSTSSGSYLRIGVNALGRLTAEAFDGTTSRTVTTITAYNTAQWLKAEACYTTDGSLGIRVNGREVAVTRGNPLLSLNSRRNLMLQTEQLDQSPWANTNLGTGIVPVVASNVGFDPNGSLTADRIQFSLNGGTTGSDIVRRTQSVVTPSTIHTFSFYIRSFDGVTTYNMHCVDSSGNTRDIVVTGTWQRLQVSETGTGGGVQYSIGLRGGRLPANSNTADILIWGTQVELGTVATEYQRVTTTPETNVAPLTIGNNYTLDAPFPGSIALLKLGATVPTAEQSVFMYEQEKQLFRPRALSVLPDANSIVDMSYDDATDRWAAVSTTNESYWNGLVRSSVASVPAGSYSKISTTSGVELVSRTTTNPGVDVSIPPYALREELVKKSEAASRLSRKTVTYDYTGGFTGNITTGSTSILSVAGLVYPTSYIGARISGTGIPANTTITGVSGTTIYISAPATATTSTLAITFLDFNLPAGMEAKVVLTAGVIKREGSTSDYTRLFDGFIETIRFAVAPGSTAWVQIQATRTTQ